MHASWIEKRPEKMVHGLIALKTQIPDSLNPRLQKKTQPLVVFDVHTRYSRKMITVIDECYIFFYTC